MSRLSRYIFVPLLALTILTTRFSTAEELWVGEDRGDAREVHLLDTVQFIKSVVFYDVQNTFFRWNGPIRYAVLSENRIINAVADAHLADLSGYTALPFIKSPLISANFVIVVRHSVRRAALTEYRDLYQKFLSGKRTPEWEMERIRNQGGCFHSLGFEGPAIVNAILFIDSDLPVEALRRCFFVDTIRMLGFLNSPENPDIPSIFQRKGSSFQMTTKDALALRVLYDPRMYSGMPSVDADRIIESIVKNSMYADQPL